MSRVLIVDDDPDILLVVEAALRLGGHEPVSSSDAGIALELLDYDRFDCLILDLQMPEVSGLDLLRRIRGRRAHEDLPVLVLSAARESSARLQSFRLGAADYLAKPFEPEELVHRVERLVASRRPHTAAIEGDIASYPIPELAQTLEQSARTGILQIDSPAGPGRVTVVSGRPVEATFAALTGEQAVFALFALREGTFRFRETGVEPRGGRLSPMTSLLMGYHWFLDELRHLAEHLPEERERLELAKGVRDLVAAQARAHEFPQEMIVAGIEQGEVSLRKLRRSLPLAPIVVDVTVAWLVSVGALIFPGGKAPPTGEIVPTRRADLELGLRRLQIASGRSWGDLHVLLAAGGEAWASLLEHLGREPVLEEQLAASRRRLEVLGAVCLEVPVGRSWARFHVVHLEVCDADQITMALSLSSGAILWARRDEAESARRLLAPAAGNSEISGLVVATAGSLSPALLELAETAGWRVVSSVPRDVATTLELLY